MTPVVIYRWECGACGEMAVSRDEPWVAHARDTHHRVNHPLACPEPLVPETNPIMMALYGAFDG